MITFLKLSHLALGNLSIPAASATSERTISACSNTSSKRRARLTLNGLKSVVDLTVYKQRSAKSHRI